MGDCSLHCFSLRWGRRNRLQSRYCGLCDCHQFCICVLHPMANAEGKRGGGCSDEIGIKPSASWGGNNAGGCFKYLTSASAEATTCNGVFVELCSCRNAKERRVTVICLGCHCPCDGQHAPSCSMFARRSDR